MEICNCITLGPAGVQQSTILFKLCSFRQQLLNCFHISPKTYTLNGRLSVHVFIITELTCTSHCLSAVQKVHTVLKPSHVCNSGLQQPALPA